jgi:hypothetical protein
MPLLVVLVAPRGVNERGERQEAGLRDVGEHVGPSASIVCGSSVDCGAIALLHDFFGLMTGLRFLGLKT